MDDGPRTWRLIDDLDAGLDATGQMAADEALLDDVAAGGLSALRVYRWSSPALSVGRFQPDDDVDTAACSRLDVDVVRRPTGGRALLHGGDVTYAVAMPIPAGAAGKVDAVYGRLAAGLIAGLGRLGVTAAVADHREPSGPVCFAGQQGSDLRVGNRKLCGSAQVHRNGAVLQHGSILCSRLSIDETDVLRFAAPRDRAAARARLREATVTLGELGATTDPRVVVDGLVRGFAERLCVRLVPQGPGPVRR